MLMLQILNQMVNLIALIMISAIDVTKVLAERDERLRFLPIIFIKILIMALIPGMNIFFILYQMYVYKHIEDGAQR